MFIFNGLIKEFNSLFIIFFLKVFISRFLIKIYHIEFIITN